MTFQALITEKTDDGYVSRVGERDFSDLPEGEVLVRVGWSSLNYKDALSASGNKGVTRNYPHTPGIDAVGVVEEAGEGPFSAGDAVICTGYDLGMNTAGGYGDYIRVPAEWLAPLPADLSPRDAMLLGTAGLTAALCVEALLETGLQPEQGEVLVTGATGGVGSTAVSILSRLGFQVVAVTGKEDAHDWLRQLGASDIIDRTALVDGLEKPLLKPRWGGVVDCVGGDTLVSALKGLKYGCSAACCGLAGSPKLENATVFPFILRGVNLLGVDSVELPCEVKQQMWQLLAGDWRPDLAGLEAAEVNRSQLPEWFGRILKGGVRGRVVVKVAD
ncbi:YhdH/YhfP family quinone oxidoreductase [Alloalcanivorax gelatiniphagus]|uniref:Acryloyl-CoA reductase n=1 Tax=Alloalcanivorax gelatiniphagus TaxID=1194167 RepID=A0ABY2XQB9_9GAMM|nr:YhdH/YhfP family quinone oxidoreductase [Alloalcanivorax gelatiniphagus]TMW14158.1 acryloyl-CoA reductase [Alloalcanivorax gelatiniphagus]|tara:strand:+ start:21834 stop:22826 length:993 start_codon:yes stop_codon:yes gene_type:complete